MLAVSCPFACPRLVTVGRMSSTEEGDRSAGKLSGAGLDGVVELNDVSTELAS